MPLDANTKPIGIIRFNGLNNSIRSAAADAEVGTHLANRLMMATVHADLTRTIDLLHAGTGLQVHSVPMWPSRRVVMRQGARWLLGEVYVETAAANGVQLLHTGANG